MGKILEEGRDGEQTPVPKSGGRSPTRLIDEVGMIGGLAICATSWDSETPEIDAGLVVQRFRRPWAYIAHSAPQAFTESLSASLIITGHTHVARWEFNAINVGRCEGPIPNHAWISWPAGECEIHIHHGHFSPVFRHRLT